MLLLRVVFLQGLRARLSYICWTDSSFYEETVHILSKATLASTRPTFLSVDTTRFALISFAKAREWTLHIPIHEGFSLILDFSQSPSSQNLQLCIISSAPWNRSAEIYWNFETEFPLCFFQEIQLFSIHCRHWTELETPASGDSAYCCQRKPYWAIAHTLMMTFSWPLYAYVCSFWSAATLFWVLHTPVACPTALRRLSIKVADTKHLIHSFLVTNLWSISGTLNVHLPWAWKTSKTVGCSRFPHTDYQKKGRKMWQHISHSKQSSCRAKMERRIWPGTTYIASSPSGVSPNGIFSLAEIALVKSLQTFGLAFTSLLPRIYDFRNDSRKKLQTRSACTVRYNSRSTLLSGNNLY